MFIPCARGLRKGDVYCFGAGPPPGSRRGCGDSLGTCVLSPGPVVPGTRSLDGTSPRASAPWARLSLLRGSNVMLRPPAVCCSSRTFFVSLNEGNFAGQDLRLTIRRLQSLNSDRRVRSYASLSYVQPQISISCRAGGSAFRLQRRNSQPIVGYAFAWRPSPQTTTEATELRKHR